MIISLHRIIFFHSEFVTLRLEEDIGVTETGTFCLGEGFDATESGITDTVDGFGMTENAIFCQDDKKD